MTITRTKLKPIKRVRLFIKVLVCGGRDLTDYAYVSYRLDDVQSSRGIRCVVHGDAPGADTMAATWAHNNKVKEVWYPPKKKTYDKTAGPMRNQQMLDEEDPDLVLAFPGGKETADMIQRAAKNGYKVVQIKNSTTCICNLL